MRKMTEQLIEEFADYLINEEKSKATLEKYTRDIRSFFQWLKGREFDKAVVLEYKNSIMEKYAPASVNSMLSSLNSFFSFNNWHECRVKTLKIQRQSFSSGAKELSKDEYERLLKAALNQNNERLYMLMQTICSTGIRVSELEYITVDAIRTGRACIYCKGKNRCVLLSPKLCQMLIKYARKHEISRGSIFVSKNGRPLSRINIWADMKMLCKDANVDAAKVFPHNLRHLFARTYYSLHKDISRLADILGHSSVNTTRIYTMESGKEHVRQMQMLGLLHLQI